MAQMNMLKSVFVVDYEGINITDNISEHVSQITYTDNLSGQSDEISLEIIDVNGRWRSDWYPGKGDRLTLQLGWDPQTLVNCGNFIIDEIEFSGHPTSITIKALATGINKALRTKNTVTYEKKTLAQIAQVIADRNGLILEGQIENLVLDKLTQTDSDITFLSKLADEYDYAIKILDNRLIFTSISELLDAEPSFVLSATKIQPGWRVRDQLKSVPKATIVESHDPNTGKVIKTTVNNSGSAVESSVQQKTSSDDVEKIRTKTGSSPAAKRKAEADIAKKNREGVVAQFSFAGNPDLQAGNIIQLEEFGQLSGNYLIKQLTHSISRGNGFETKVSVWKINDNSKISETNNGNSKSKKSGGLKVYDKPV